MQTVQFKLVPAQLRAHFELLNILKPLLPVFSQVISEDIQSCMFTTKVATSTKHFATGHSVQHCLQSISLVSNV